MTMSIARLSAQSGLKYLFKTTMMDDLTVTPEDATSYYMKAGTPQGRWLGSGLQGISRSPEDKVTESDAKAIFDHSVHPDTGAPIGRPHGRPKVIQNGNGQPEPHHAVVGFDLTFSVPKSVSVLWALSPRSIQNQILQTHHEAVSATLEWLEDAVIHTRAGRNGVAHIGTYGAIAAAFDHWESRVGDPQLHTHLVIANRVQRITDGAWVTLDSRTLYKAAVAASEHYNGILFDSLRRNLGTDTDIRAPASNTHNPSQQLAGVDDALIHAFSNRARLIDLETDRLVAQWITEHGSPPTATTVLKLRQQAALSTRTPKADTVTPLHELSVRWREQAATKGFEPGTVLDNTIRRSRVAPFRACDFTANWTEAVGSLTRERVAGKRATWNRWNLLAEAERVCADIRCQTPDDRTAMIDAVATAAEEQSISLNEYRYTLPMDSHPDLALADRSVFDFQGARLYTDAGTLANEDIVMAARDDDGGPSVRPAAAMELLTTFTHGGRFELSRDQRAVAAAVLLSGNRLDAVAGPAGTGKTTTLGAVKAAWESEFGAGSIVGLAPAAASAEVLGRELAMVTENVAKWLHESVGRGASYRAARFFDVEQKLRGRPADPGALRLAQEASRLAAEQNKWRFHPNQLVIVDEASMVSTLQLSALVKQANEAGAKVLLVGDPAQLDAIDAGGVLGWLDRQGKAVRLTTIRRFEHEWERAASLKLRAGDFEAIADYEGRRRIEHGTYLDMVERAYSRWQADINEGRSSILIAADNETVSMLNERAQADRAIQGEVDAEHTVLLGDGMRAGAGDTVIARHNDRRIRDSAGDFIRNGTLLDVVRTGLRDGSLTGIRRDTEVQITLRRDYVESSVELGYATTAHRSQGITVDTGHTVVTQGRLTRELLYVSMTRGRTGNHAYVIESDPLEDEILDPSSRAWWRQILGEVLAAEGAERTAHEVREAELLNADSLERLASEYDYLAQIAASEDFTQFLDRHAPGVGPELQQSPAWGAAVSAWRASVTASRPSAQRLVLNALQESATARDLAAIVHSRLRKFLIAMPGVDNDPLMEPPPTDRQDLLEMIRQVKTRVEHRMEHVARTAIMNDSQWKRSLLEAIGAHDAPPEAMDLIRRIAIYRDRWGIEDSPLPLGPAPASYEWERQKELSTIERAVDRARASSVRRRAPDWKGELPATERLINVGWQL